MNRTVLVLALSFAVVMACGGASSTSVTEGASSTAPVTTADGAVTTVTCTSGVTWGGGDRGSPAMHPGRACITCHESEDGPLWTIAGTVYPSLHEPNDCNGTRGRVEVVITDAKGATLTLPVNTAGNFFTSTAVTFPVHAKVVSGSTENAMIAAQTSGDCNSCHTPGGASAAPGRVAAP